jgi:hypothetical protein
VYYCTHQYCCTHHHSCENSIKTGPKQHVAEKRKTGSDKRGKRGEIEKSNAEGGEQREREREGGGKTNAREKEARKRQREWN